MIIKLFKKKALLKRKSFLKKFTLTKKRKSFWENINQRKKGKKEK
jgi:hypothetical protein